MIPGKSATLVVDDINDVESYVYMYQTTNVFPF